MALLFRRPMGWPVKVEVGLVAILMQGDQQVPKTRRHDIDWLRVILFGLLIPFHVAIGVYWSTYGDEINQNSEPPSLTK